jgi:hypothetical protein
VFHCVTSSTCSELLDRFQEKLNLSRMLQAGHVARTLEMRNLYKIQVIKLQGKTFWVT